MEVFRRIDLIRKVLDNKKSAGNSIGLVPTMGALHRGHLELVRASIKENDMTVCSIYVNPIQFNEEADFQRYPRNESQDLEILKNAGCDIAFCPDNDQMIAGNRYLSMDFGPLSEGLEGKFRKGHFNGVGLIVSKLFNIIDPDVAYFGQKDLQQYVIVSQLAKELCLKVSIKRVPTAREENGLALSSRNTHLSDAQREEAAIFYQALVKSMEMLDQNIPIELVKKEVTKMFNLRKINLEYFEIVNLNNFSPTKKIEDKGEYGLCIAGYVGKVRLIDNLIYSPSNVY